MSLQRGVNVRGWEGVTHGLEASTEEQHAWQFSLIGMLLAVIIAGVLALMLSLTDVQSGLRALLVIGFLLLSILFLKGLYSAMVGVASGGGGAAKASPKPAPRAAAKPAAAPAPKAAPAPAPAAKAAPAPAAPADADVDPGQRPEALDGPRGGSADDLTRIKGVGPKLADLCNTLGFYHYDQIAAWSSDEVAWVDQNLEGFKGRVSRDDWVSQAKILATGGETEFSARQ